MDEKVIIIGGGMAGLLSAIQLQNQQVPCLVIEKKQYPFHRVCGEYISKEAEPFLKKLSLYPSHFNPPSISRFQLSSVRGKNSTMPLDLGGFGISRYSFDHFLYHQALSCGVEFLFEEVSNLIFENNQFVVTAGDQHFTSKVVVGAFGKRSLIDVKLGREFVKRRSPFVGIKYHIKTDHADDLIALHNFEGGYCGISNVENGVSNMCYLVTSSQLKKCGGIPELERSILQKNPLLKYIFTNSDFLWEKPEVISEISFDTKSPVENHMVMVGDAAGMITPLCGNGMAMAIHASKIACEHVVRFWYLKTLLQSTTWRSIPLA